MGTGECNTLGNPAMDKDTSYQFSLWILIALAKIYFFHMVLIWQKDLCIILIGTNFKQPQSQGLSFIFPLYWDWKMRDPGNEVASLRYLSLILKPFLSFSDWFERRGIISAYDAADPTNSTSTVRKNCTEKSWKTAETRKMRFTLGLVDKYYY